MSDKWQFAIQEIQTAQELVGKELKGWKVEEIIEVRQNDEEGRSSKSIGYFRDPNVAEAFAGPKDTMGAKFTVKVLVLTDGKAAFLIDKKEVLDMFDDEGEAARLREQILAKLSPAEQKLMGI